MENKHSHIFECENLFQKAASLYVSFHKKQREVCEFYLDELSNKTGYVISYKSMIDIIDDDLHMVAGVDQSMHLFSFPKKGEIFKLIRKGSAYIDGNTTANSAIFPIQYLNCEIIRSEMGFIEVLPTLIYDRKTIAYPLKATNATIIDENQLPLWNFNK